MLRIPALGDAFLFGQEPFEQAGGLEAALSQRLDGGPLPDLLYWDGQFDDGAPGRVLFGKGGLDPLLASQYDLSGCVAIREGALRSLPTVVSTEAFTQAVALLAKSPSVSSLWCSGFSGRPTAGMPSRRVPPRAFHTELVSVALLIDDPKTPMEPFFAALAEQEIDARVEVVVVGCNMEGRSIKALATALEEFGAADSRLRIRRYNLAGQLDRPYLANIAVALATAESVVIADPRCVPQTPRLIQSLASWASSADGATASPRVEVNRAVYAGAALAETAHGSSILRLHEDAPLADRLRLVAAPVPWIFAVPRNRWLASGGAPCSPAALWTASLAGRSGPRGRHILVGSEQARWVGDGTGFDPRASAPAPANLRKASLKALRAPETSPSLPAPSAVPRRQTGAPVSGPPGKAGSRAIPKVPAAFSDAFPNTAELRVLLFADAFGPSQAIPFELGLAAARARGAVAVRLVEEAAFAKDASEVQVQVRSLFADTRPTVVVVSRLGSRPVWRAVRHEARRCGVPLVFHIDDDLFDLPVTLGLERYRLARQPGRLHTLYECLNDCDLTLTASPALAHRLERLGGHRRVMSMAIGSGAAPPAVRRRAAHNGRLLIGYMGSASHNDDLAMIAPAVNRVMESYGHVDVALFGSIARQPAAKLLTGRVTTHPAVLGDYAGFRRRLDELQFDIGLAPLRDIAFSRCKTLTKWVEYAEAGVVCVASDVEPYQPVFAANAALAARPDQWEAVLRQAVEDHSLRQEVVRNADRLLRNQFGWDQLERSVIAALSHGQSARVAA